MNERKARQEWNKWNKLLVSVAIDLVGLSDFIFPGAAQVRRSAFCIRPIELMACIVYVHNLSDNKLGLD